MTDVIKCSLDTCSRVVTAPKLTGDLCIICWKKAQAEKVSIPTHIPPTIEMVKEEVIIEQTTADRILPTLSEVLQETKNEEVTIASIISSDKRNDLDNFTIDSIIDINKSVNPNPNIINETAGQEEVQKKAKEFILSKRVDLATVTPNSERKDKVCQSCLERVQTLVPATKMWANNFHVCDPCYNLLLSQTVAWPDTLGKTFQESSPREILENHEQFFTYRAAMNVNLTIDEIAANLEHLTKVLFVIRRYAEQDTADINRLKKESRDRLKLEDQKYDPDMPSAETAKAKISLSKDKKSGVKLTKEEKMIDTLASTMATAECGQKSGALFEQTKKNKIEQILQAGKNARAKELENIVGGKK